ncbi:MAG TPA: SpoIIE family protein phosphatase [Jatrophihabitans sp.]|jgi:CheY-like chemotaxis protein
MSDLLARVLLVEDDEGDALLVRECLIEAGVPEVDVLWERTIADGIGALDESPGCVLLDLGLPDADGLDALYQLVAAAGPTPVIVLTGRNDRTGVEAVAAGAQDYLIKDNITPELLDRSIRYAVERCRAQATELALREEQMLSVENGRLERGLLPKPLLRDDLVACATYYQPGRNLAVLGGDFYDVVQTADGRVRAVIGDVMGHGPDEAALGVHLRVAWRTLVLAGVPDDTILTSMSRLLSAEGGNGGRFVTACDVAIEPDLTVSLRDAGHPPPLVCARGRAGYLAPEIGPPLGIEGLTGARWRWPDSGGWPVTRTTLSPASSLLLYTDGLLDAYRVPANGASLGVDELLEATSEAVATGREITSWIPAIVGSAPARSLDDTAVVVLTVRATGDR